MAHLMITAKSMLTKPIPAAIVKFVILKVPATGIVMYASFLISLTTYQAETPANTVTNKLNMFSLFFSLARAGG